MTFEIPNPHNACFRDFFKDPDFVKAFIRYHIPEDICTLLDLDTIQVDLSGFVSQEHREYYADVMVTVQLKGHTENVNIYILLEHKSTPELLTRLQILNYMVQKWMDLKRNDQLPGRLPVIIPVVIYHGKGKWNYSRKFSDLFELPAEVLRPFVPEFKHMIHDISCMQDDEFKTTTILEVFHLLFKYIHYPELETKLQEIYDLLETIPDQEKCKQYLQAIVQYVAVQGPISLEKLGEYTRRLPGGKEAMQTAAQQIRNEEALRYEQEKPKWIQHGELKNAQEMLIKSLKMRFDLVKPAIKEQIRSIESLDTLNDLFEVSFKCSNIEEFTERLSQVTEN